ncbi:MAG TPA: hypothetical protein EYQ80_03215, partial [Candidatus Poseidoniales archaeon]|nr:hypothetical protein [Candidatus Poseidoniales archaeon]
MALASVVEPPTYGVSFRAHFRMMFREEWRQNVDFARKRHIMMFPIMLALVTMVITIGLRFLTGEADIVVGDRKVPTNPHFSWVKRCLQRLGSLRVIVCGPSASGRNRTTT